MLLLLSLLACGPKSPEPTTPEPVVEPTSDPAPAEVRGLYHVQRDTRRCAAPLCGGWWVLSVNRPASMCPEGPAERCYAVPGPELPDGAIVEGSLVLSAHTDLRAERWWAPVGPGAKAEVFQLGDNGVRCVKAPCESISATVVGGEAVPVSDVDASAVDAHDPEALGEAIVAGTLFAAGSVETRENTRVFVATELWLPASR